MKRLFSVLLVAVMLVSATGCSSWWQKFKSDPAAQVQSVISTLETVITIASVVFAEVKPLIPEAKREEAQQRFSHAILAVENAKRVLRDGLDSAAAARQDPPNIQAMVASAVKAAEDLRSLIRELQDVVRTSASSNSVARLPAAPDDLDAAVEAVKRFQH